MDRIIRLSRLKDADPLQVGIIAAQRARLKQAGLPVAPGFVLTGNFFKEYLIENNLHHGFFTVLKSAHGIKEIHDHILNMQFPQHLEDAIVRACEKYESNMQVTTSAAFHDAVFERNNLKENQMVDAIKQCWASVFHESRRKWLNRKTVFPTLVIQKDPQAKKAGSVYTHNPVNKAGSRMIIEMHYPSRAMIAVKKEDGSLLGLRDCSGSIPLSDDEKDKIIEVAKKAEKHFGAPQKIDWVLGNELYIQESRNITQEDATYFFNQSTSSTHNSTHKSKIKAGSGN